MVTMRLEAKDRKNPELVCVATIKEMAAGKIKVHFDGWESGVDYDYWTEVPHEDLHYVGWCEKTGHKLEAPKGTPSGSFSWEAYLKDKRAKPVTREILEGGGIESEDEVDPRIAKHADEWRSRGFCINDSTLPERGKSLPLTNLGRL